MAKATKTTFKCEMTSKATNISFTTVDSGITPIHADKTCEALNLIHKVYRF